MLLKDYNHSEAFTFSGNEEEGCELERVFPQLDSEGWQSAEWKKQGSGIYRLFAQRLKQHNIWMDKSVYKTKEKGVPSQEAEK